MLLAVQDEGWLTAPTRKGQIRSLFPGQNRPVFSGKEKSSKSEGASFSEPRVGLNIADVCYWQLGGCGGTCCTLCRTSEERCWHLDVPSLFMKYKLPL